MTNTEITAFLTQNRATKTKAIDEILTKVDAAAVLAAALQRKWEKPIRTIRDGLAAANGGYSQYGSVQIAHAIRGHLNNGLLYGQEAALADLFREAALQEEEQWPEQDAAEIHREIAAAFKAADAAFAAALAADSGT